MSSGENVRHLPARHGDWLAAGAQRLEIQANGKVSQGEFGMQFDQRSGAFPISVLAGSLPRRWRRFEAAISGEKPRARSASCAATIWRWGTMMSRSENSRKRNVAIGLHRENRSLVRRRGNAAIFERRQHAEKFGRQRQIAAGGFEIRPAESLAPCRGQRDWGTVLEIFANDER